MKPYTKEEMTTIRLADTFGPLAHDALAAIQERTDEIIYHSLVTGLAFVDVHEPRLLRCAKGCHFSLVWPGEQGFAQAMPMGGVTMRRYYLQLFPWREMARA